MSLAGLSLRDLEYLVAVAECGHFGRASAQCAVSQPALSAQIRKLERYLGVTVFDRSPGRITATPTGEAILAQAAIVLREARTLIEKARSDISRLSGRFRIGAIPTLGPYLLPHALQPIRRAFPEIELIFSEGHTEALMAALRRGGIDAVLACAPDEDKDLRIQSLFLEPFLLVHRPDHAPRWPLVGLNEPIVVLDEGHCLRDQALSACGLGACIASPHAAGIEMLRHMVAAGEGISLIPALAAHALGTLDGRIAYTRLGEPVIGRDVALVGRADDPRMAHMSALAELIREAQGPADICGLCPRRTSHRVTH
jgi:LysR family hydrogen peroxide-inducible transcriptional activator